MRTLLEFFDEAPVSSQGHATALCAVIGEDLGAATFKHYFEKKNAKVRILAERPKPGRKKGQRLDRWIEVVEPAGNGFYYQTEIKSWSAHAIGSASIPIDATSDQISLHRMKLWKSIWEIEQNQPNDDSMRKVLLPMPRPLNSNPGFVVRPLLIFWYLLHPVGQHETFFVQPLGQNVSKVFDQLYIFSVSSYLRSLTIKEIDLDMPDSIVRMRWLKKIISDEN